MTVGERLKQLREIGRSMPVSQGRVAQVTGVNVGTICKIEKGVSGSPTVKTISKICDFFNITLSEFFEGVDLSQ